MQEKRGTRLLTNSYVEIEEVPVRVVWVYRQTWYVALMTTDLTLSIEHIIEYYGAHWKNESGFKEFKQEISSSDS